MATAKYDPELDLQGTFPQPSLFEVAGRTALSGDHENVILEPESPEEKFMTIAQKDPKYDFVPDSRRSVTLAISNLNNRINEVHIGASKPVGASISLYDYIKDLVDRAEFQIGVQSNALSPIRFEDETTFAVEALKNNPAAMRSLALFQVRAAAFSQSDWVPTYKPNLEKSIKAELEFMQTLDDTELTKRWHAAWRSTQTEFAFWTAKAKSAKKDQHLRWLLDPYDLE